MSALIFTRWMRSLEGRGAAMFPWQAQQQWRRSLDLLALCPLRQATFVTPLRADRILPPGPGVADAGASGVLEDYREPSDCRD